MADSDKKSSMVFCGLRFYIGTYDDICVNPLLTCQKG
jgi:hypothetical protein